MQNVNTLIGAQGADVREQLRQLLAVLPLAVHVPDRAVRPQPRRLEQHQPGWGVRPLRGASRAQQPRGLAAPRRLLHGPDRQVPERVREQAARPARLVGVARRRPGSLPPLRLHHERQRRARRTTGSGPGTTSRTSSPGRRSTLVQRRAPKSQPFFLWLTYSAPHSGGPYTDPDPPHQLRRRPEAATAIRPRLRLRAAAKTPELRRARRLRQAGRHPQASPPERQRDRLHRAQLPLRAGVAAGGGRRRREGGGRAPGVRGARQHPARLHVRQRLLSRRAPDRARARCAIYEESIRVPLDDAGARHPERGDHRPAGDQRRPRADDRGRRGRPRRASPWTAARCSP